MKQQYPRVFLAHASGDKPFVTWLASNLQGAGVTVWFDTWEIAVGDSIVDKINDGLRQADYLAIVLSPASVSSRWVTQEINAATMRQIDTAGVQILPVLLESCAVPPLLSHLAYADFRSDRPAGLAELLRTLFPASSAWHRLREVEHEISILLSSVDPLPVFDSPFVSEAASIREQFLTAAHTSVLLDEAVLLRYRIEAMRHGVHPEGALDFHHQFKFLLTCGLQITSEAWVAIRNARNVHGHFGDVGLSSHTWSNYDIRELKTITAILCSNNTTKPSSESPS